MRAILVTGFVLLFMSKLLYACIWQIHFYSNQQEIATMECENKNRPEMHCNGKCYLAKKLRLADEQLQAKKDQQSHSLNKIKSLEDTDLSFSIIQHFELTSVVAEPKSPVTNLIDTYQFETHSSIFHPPCYC